MLSHAQTGAGAFACENVTNGRRTWFAFCSGKMLHCAPCFTRLGTHFLTIEEYPITMEKHGEHHKKHEDQATNYLGFKDQVRQFQMKIRSMLPRCESIDKCPKGTCCWKGKCKMLPHRINQRCSDQCPCNDEKDMLFCHLRTEGHNKRKYGRCFIKGTEIGMKGVNFIPEAIEKLKDVEKKLKKFGREQRKMKREHKKKDDKQKRGGKKHKHAGKRGNKKHDGRRHKHHKEMI
eukprot:gene6903-12514_t